MNAASMFEALTPENQAVVTKLMSAMLEVQGEGSGTQITEAKGPTMDRPRKVSVQEAAWLMGKSTLFVREAMKRGAIEIGVAQQLSPNRWNLLISPPELAKYLGVSLDELWAMLDAKNGGAADAV